MKQNIFFCFNDEPVALLPRWLATEERIYQAHNVQIGFMGHVSWHLYFGPASVSATGMHM